MLPLLCLLRTALILFIAQKQQQSDPDFVLVAGVTAFHLAPLLVASPYAVGATLVPFLLPLVDKLPAGFTPVINALQLCLSVCLSVCLLLSRSSHFC